MLFNIDRGTGQRGVKEEEADRGEDVEEESDGEGADELDFKRWMREDEG